MSLSTIVSRSLLYDLSSVHTQQQIINNKLSALNAIREAFQTKKQGNFGPGPNRVGGRQKIKKIQVSVGLSSKLVPSSRGY